MSSESEDTCPDVWFGFQNDVPLQKDGEILRAINRSYYQADAFEYPACFARHGRTTYLVHCPDRYDTLEFAEVETGKVETRRTQAPHTPDIFHSRLQVSPDGKRLLSRGWRWRPNPGKEISTACFINGDSVLLGTTGEEDLGYLRLP